MSAARYPQLADRDWLHARYVTDGRTTRLIAAEIGCSPEAISQALRRHGIPARPAVRATTIRVGDAYGRLTVIAEAGSKGGCRIYRCRCDCGVETVVTGNHLRSGNTRSCGCLHREQVTENGQRSTRHGHTASGQRSPTFTSWRSMLDRCYRPSHTSFERYGGRPESQGGPVTVCERWLSVPYGGQPGAFERFLEDLGERPEGMTLDRVDNGQGYSKSNCRWATPAEQRANQRPRKREPVTA